MEQRTAVGFIAFLIMAGLCVTVLATLNLDNKYSRLKRKYTKLLETDARLVEIDRQQDSVIKNCTCLSGKNYRKFINQINKKK